MSDSTVAVAPGLFLHDLEGSVVRSRGHTL
jgi:hypothetical protein